VLLVMRAIRGRFNARFDLNGDGRIDLRDVAIATRQIGRRC
jgi:hypothetical protein